MGNSQNQQQNKSFFEAYNIFVIGEKMPIQDLDTELDQADQHHWNLKRKKRYQLVLEVKLNEKLFLIFRSRRKISKAEGFENSFKAKKNIDRRKHQ